VHDPATGEVADTYTMVIGEANAKGTVHRVAAQMLNPKVQVYGDCAILTYNYAGVVQDASGDTKPARAKSTRVFVKQNGKWVLDGAEGADELVYRRVGRNELDAIQTALAFVDAQNEYAEKDRGAGVGVYAQRIVSTSGKKDGLYWPGGDSPLGELAAQASAEGYKVGEGPIPYHGYYFRILTQQGPNAPGGTLNYVVRGKMIGGFALLAWPAEYGNSGVMTFLVNHNGVVYQKNLGDYTNKLAGRINAFNPDQTWKKVDAAKP
jgi:hypothetical protein